MNEQFQFSLKHLFFAVSLAAVCLGIGKWCYIKYVDRIRPVTRDFELQFYLGKRVSLSGRYQYVGSGSSFQIVRFGKKQEPIAIMNICVDGSPVPQFPDDALIAVTGRLIVPPADALFPLPIERRGWVDKHLVFHKASGVQEFGCCSACITAEEVKQVSD